MLSWGFLEDGAGILPASDMADPLGVSNLKPADILVRESVQNSLDERRFDVDEPVRIQFELRVVTGEAKHWIVENLNLHELADRRDHFQSSHSWFDRGKSTFDDISNPDVGFPILTISDFNANGLGGRWNRRGSKNDRFFNLVLSIGGSLKWADMETGNHSVSSLGSYGYGKMAFALASNIRTMIYYSTFQPDDGTQGARCRAMASAFLPPHLYEDRDYAGQAYFGECSGETRNPRQPLIDDAAHAWIKKLGLSTRSNDDTGTTVVLLSAEPTMEQIVTSCETWWWPRMRDPEPTHRVEFEFVGEDGKISICNPRSRADLSPFIDCYKILEAHRTDGRHHVEDVVVRPPTEGKNLTSGRLALKALGTQNCDDEEHTLTNSVALVRNGLVIKYEKNFCHEDRPPVVGVFSPSRDDRIMQAFVFSEPPPHDEWTENSQRLKDKYPSWGSELIRLTKAQLRTKTRDFQTRQMNRPDVEQTDAAAFLRRTLGQLFKQDGREFPPAPPPSERRAFTIVTRASGRHLNGMDCEDFVVFRISLLDDVPVNSMIADVTMTLRALADSYETPEDVIPCEVISPCLAKAGKDGTNFTVELGQGEYIDVEARARVHPHWKTRWNIKITGEGR